MLEQGQNAPNFKQPNQNNDIISLDDFLGKKNVILYFYPKDDTPGCTIEANDFTSFVKEFAEADTAVLGVSKDGCDSHQHFIEKFGIQFDLLADTEGTLCNDYDVWQEKEKNGEKKWGIVRSTFIIDKSGKLAYVEYGVKPEGHAQAMLEKVRSMG